MSKGTYFGVSRHEEHNGVNHCSILVSCQNILNKIIPGKIQSNFEIRWPVQTKPLTWGKIWRHTLDREFNLLSNTFSDPFLSSIVFVPITFIWKPAPQLKIRKMSTHLTSFDLEDVNLGSPNTQQRSLLPPPSCQCPSSSPSGSWDRRGRFRPHQGVYFSDRPPGRRLTVHFNNA